jgi:outer membrane protein TolC
LDTYVENQLLETPLLRFYNYKLADLEVERRLKFQQLLPYVALKGNILSKNYYNYTNWNKGYIPANNQWGLSISMPLFLREARGNYQRTKIKIRETELERAYKQTQSLNKVRTYFNETALLQQQVSLTRNMYQNYSSLLRNEELRFRQGESSLFVLNTRENKIIETLQKEIEIRLKYFKARYALDWVTGRLE